MPEINSTTISKEYWMAILKDYFGEPKGWDTQWKLLRFHWRVDSVWYHYGDYAVGLEMQDRPCISIFYKPLTEQFIATRYIKILDRHKLKDALAVLDAIIHPENLPLCVGIPEFADILQVVLKDQEEPK